MSNEGCRIIYITTECNLECKYCYEKRKRDEGFPIKSVTQKEIEMFAQSIINHPDPVVTAILFGGEPFLKPELMEQTYDYVLKKCNEVGKLVHFNLITNGTLLKNNETLIRKMLNDRCTTIEVSYDGDTHDDRVFPDGTSSRTCVESNLEWMIEKGFPFKISSVVDDTNPNVLKNITTILLKYKPFGITVRPKNNTANNVKPELRKKFELLFKKLGIPICNQTCRVCGGCKWDDNSRYEYIIPENDEIKSVTKEDRKDNYRFDHF